MRHFPTEYTLHEVVRIVREGPQIRDSGRLLPARPLGLPSFWLRVRLAWEVFTGRADVLRWPDNQ